MNTVKEKLPSIQYPERFYKKPFFHLTKVMLDCVRDHNYEILSRICDDDFGIVDINPKGESEIIRDRKDWESWFKNLFAQLERMEAITWSEITNYEAIQKTDMGYSVVDFDQILVLGSKKMKFKVIATIIWKKQAGEWKEARYHSSLINVIED
jgi:ketosteroid isomerase-like protein